VPQNQLIENQTVTFWHAQINSIQRMKIPKNGSRCILRPELRPIFPVLSYSDTADYAGSKFLPFPRTAHRAPGAEKSYYGRL
jgi:hypothetical protein